jgi:riboflavin kinase/FMN adenylyltransferase
VRRWRGIDDTPGEWGRSVVTIGVFDGVHRGHQALIGQAVRRAADLGVRSVVVTFDPHPAEVFRPGGPPPVLTTLDRKAALVEGLGVDGLCVLPFTVEFSRLGPEEFVRDVLAEHLHAAEVVVGENFRFGHKAAGDVAVLADLGSRHGFRVSGVPLLASTGTTFSSTYVRGRVAEGDVEAAAEALGRAHRVEGVVVRGDSRGRELGYPTANLALEPYTAVPADGVYAGRLVRDTPAGPVALPAAISVGTNPTFDGRDRRVEAYVLDFDGDLYDETVAVEFVSRLRGMERFGSARELVTQMADDVRLTRERLAG